MSLRFHDLQTRTPEDRQSQRPYRYGLILLCVGALFNWLGLAQSYVEPIRYIGVGCIIAGALLICAAMCRWLGRSQQEAQVPDTTLQVISVPPPLLSEIKPPDYETVITPPPSYEDAIKLSPLQLQVAFDQAGPSSEDSTIEPNDEKTVSGATPPPCYTRPKEPQQKNTSRFGKTYFNWR